MLTLLWLYGCATAERDTGKSDTSDSGDSGVDTAETGETADTSCEVDWYYDGDGDGAGLTEAHVRSCEAPFGYVGSAGDCDDADASRHPSAVEVCDDVDQDCDGVADDEPEDPTTWTRDLDGDGWGDPAGATQLACDQPEGYALPGDCDDGVASIHPDAEESCDDVDRDCDGDPTAGATDPEVVYADVDADGYGDAMTPSFACDEGGGWLFDASDCDDLDPEVHPGADERCNEVDDDCDTNVDESATDRTTWYLDRDGDGYGLDGSTTLECSVPADYAALGGDCDDSDAAVSPGDLEVCGGADEDCDGTTDEADASDASTWYDDDDGDSYGDAAASQTACTAPAGTVADDTDCDDTDAGVSPAGVESCGGADEDCDGTTDEADAADAVDHYDAAAGDGYGDAATPTHSCLPAGRVTDATDCDDTDAGANPAEVEVCGDAVDEDCDGRASACFSGTYTTADADAALLNGTAAEGFGWSAAAGDLTGDGQDDLLVVGASADELHLYAGPVSSTSTPYATFADAGGVPGIAARGLWADVDFNADGYDDLAMWPCEGSYGTYYDGSLCVAFGPVAPTDLFYPRFSANMYYSMPDGAVGDIDGDGTPEVLGNLSTSMIYAYEPADPAFTYSNVWLGTSGYTATVAGSFGGLASGGDLTGDGIDEVVTQAATRLWIFDTIGIGTVDSDAAATVNTSGSSYEGCEVLGDISGDGLDDFVWIAQSWSGGGRVYLLDTVVSGDVTSVAVASVGTSSSSSFPQSVDSVDLDGDGAEELLLGTYDDASGAAYVLYGPLAGSYTVESDAEAALQNPNATPSSYEYTLVYAVGDALGLGTETVLMSAPGYGSSAGAAWLYGM